MRDAATAERLQPDASQHSARRSRHHELRDARVVVVGYDATGVPFLVRVVEG